jgi:hypothetical protein
LKISTTQPAEAIAQSDELKRDLSLADCALLVIGSVIGSGIFLTPGNIARTVESVEGVFLVWVRWLLSFWGWMAELCHVPQLAVSTFCVRPWPHGLLYGCAIFVAEGSVATL